MIRPGGDQIGGDRDESRRDKATSLKQERSTRAEDRSHEIAHPLRLRAMCRDSAIPEAPVRPPPCHGTCPGAGDQRPQKCPQLATTGVRPTLHERDFCSKPPRHSGAHATVLGDCWRKRERCLGSCPSMLTFQQLILGKRKPGVSPKFFNFFRQA